VPLISSCGSSSGTSTLCASPSHKTSEVRIMRCLRSVLTQTHGSNLKLPTDCKLYRPSDCAGYSHLVTRLRIRNGKWNDWRHVDSVTEKRRSSTDLKCFGNLQADHHFHFSLSCF
jgi:hypothetical protein